MLLFYIVVRGKYGGSHKKIDECFHHLNKTTRTLYIFNEEILNNSILKQTTTMSRRKGDFEHRTSIFEGAYRAWSHLGGCDPKKLLADDASQLLDPLNNPHRNDRRLLHRSQQEVSSCNTTNSCCVQTSPTPTQSPSSSIPRTSEIEYAYEPLPRQGLNHPFVQSILVPWLGQDASQNEIKKGLTTLRHWWQHRKNGENATAIKQLGTERMKNVVKGYTRHFFQLSLCLVIHDQEPPPKSLDGLLFGGGGGGEEGNEIAKSSKIPKKNSNSSSNDRSVKRKINHGDQNQFDYAKNDVMMNDVIMINSGGGCCGGGGGGVGTRTRTTTNTDIDKTTQQQSIYGNPSRTPVVFVSANGDIQIAMSIQGITCSNCVKIIETALRGVKGSQPPIEGLLDAVADKDLSSAILKISTASYAKRIAHEATDLLGSLGYPAMAREMDVVDSHGVKTSFASLTAAFDIVAATNTSDLFDWSLTCNCPENGGIHHDCER